MLKKVNDMKKYFKLSYIYAILAMVGGVFYREFTKFSDFTGVTQLSKVHTHLFVLGMFFFLLVGLLVSKFDQLENQKHFKKFYNMYNLGLIITVSMLVFHGILQVKSVVLSKALIGSISGIAGIGHLLLGLGIIFFFQSLLAVSKN